MQVAVVTRTTNGKVSHVGGGLERYQESTARVYSEFSNSAGLFKPSNLRCGSTMIKFGR